MIVQRVQEAVEQSTVGLRHGIVKITRRTNNNKGAVA